ncbi:MAG TPA: hypothetical protein VF972_07010 [Actinomycetota bacterium]
MTNAVKHAGLGPGETVGLDVRARPRRVEVDAPLPGAPRLRAASHESPTGAGRGITMGAVHR